MFTHEDLPQQAMLNVFTRERRSAVRSGRGKARSAKAARGSSVGTAGRAKRILRSFTLKLPVKKQTNLLKKYKQYKA